MPLPKNACTSPFLSHFRIVSVIPTRRLAQIALDVGVFFSSLSNCGHNEPAVGDGSPHYYEGQTEDQGGVIGGNFGMDMVMAQDHWISMFLGIPEMQISVKNASRPNEVRRRLFRIGGETRRNPLGDHISHTPLHTGGNQCWNFPAKVRWIAP